MKDYIFIMGGNSSGTNVLSNIISSSLNCSENYPDGEGQFMPGFKGLTGYDFNLPGLFTKIEKELQDESFYDWQHNDKIWRSITNKKYIVEKSPANLCRVKMIEKNFKNSYFVFINRDPIAMAEGVHSQFGYSLEDSLNHAIRCNELTRILSKETKNSILISYEDLCDKTEDILQKIKNLIPDINDIKVFDKIKIKDVEEHGLVNRNKVNISNLSKNDLENMINILKSSEISKYYPATLHIS